MRIAFIIYDGMTTLDFAGVYDAVTRLKTMGFKDDLEYDVCSNSNHVTSFEGLRLEPNKVLNDLSKYDYVIILGGNGIAKLAKDETFIGWLKTVSGKTIKASVCGGALLLGVAGFLNDKYATTHPALIKLLERFTNKTSKDRIVDEGDVITARGVTSSIDLGLYICEKIAGVNVRVKIMEQMDYLAYSL